MPNKILIIFSHPLLEKSTVNKRLLDCIPQSDQIEIRDLYELYPEFDVDVKSEQEALKKADIIIWQHPFYWYNCPALMKQWIDLVLEYGWAYGKNGNALKDKLIFHALTTGGKQENYCLTGKDRYTVMELLEPFNQTALICGMQYLPPFVVHGTHTITAEDLEAYCIKYQTLLHELLVADLKSLRFEHIHYLNDWEKIKR